MMNLFVENHNHSESLRQSCSPFLVLIVCLLMISGCSTRPIAPGPSLPPGISQAGSLHALERLAQEFNAMRMEAKVRIHEGVGDLDGRGGEPGPWVTCRIFVSWTDEGHGSKEPAIRMTGYGPFGLTLFDLVSGPQIPSGTVLSLPRQERHIAGRFFSAWDRSIDAERLRLTLAIWVMPWMAAGDPGSALVECGAGCVETALEGLGKVRLLHRIDENAEGTDGTDVLPPPMPQGLTGPGFLASYAGPGISVSLANDENDEENEEASSSDAAPGGIGGEVLPALYYPGKMRLLLQDLGVLIEMRVKRVEAIGTPFNLSIPFG